YHLPHHHAFYLIHPHPPNPTLFPYTTLFRSRPRFGDRTLSKSAALPSHAQIAAKPAPCCGLGRDQECAGEQPEELRRQISCRSRSEEHTSELQSPYDLVCRLLLEKKKKSII